MIPPSPFSATYDSFYQKVTVTGEVGLVATTTDPNGNIIGSGVISSEGTITYNIDEGMLPGGTVITTTVGPDSANHNLKTSFYFAREGGDWYPYVFVQRDLNNGWIGQNSDDYLAPNISGEIIVEYDNEQYLVDLSEFAGEQQILLKKSGASAYPYAYDAKATNDLTKVKIRFRNVSSELFLQVGQADHFYKFFDDGIQQVGYQLAWRNAPTHSNIVIKEIPNYLPASVKNLNAMFWGDDQESYLFDSANTESKLALWDFSNVTKMISTFAYSKFYDLPISNLTLTNLVYAIDTFGYSNYNNPINWTTPNLVNTSFMFEGSSFNSPINLTMDNVTDVTCMFDWAESFNQPLEHLNMSKVQNFEAMLSGTLSFNQPLNDLDVSSAVTLQNMFFDSPLFNQPLNNWADRVSNVENMNGLFGKGFAQSNGSSFSQDISNWCVPLILSEPDNFNNEGIMTQQQKPVWGTCPVQTSQAIPFEATVKNAYPNDPYQFNGGYSWFSGENPTLLVDWGDGSPIETITDGNNFSHTYAIAQEYYNIKLWLGSTRLKELYFYDVETVHTFGDAEIAAFIFDSDFLIQVPNQLPSYVTGTYSMFKNCTSFNGDISQWNTVNVTNMNNMFEWASAFNQPIGNWNVSNVGSVSSLLGMTSMFSNAGAFNQDLSDWCVTHLTTEPENFNTNGLLSPAQKPVWGSCPVLN